MDWEDDLLALAEAPAKPKKKSKRKRKRESSASDMELSEGAGSDLEAASVKEEDSDNEAANVKNEDEDDEEELQNPADDFPLEGIYKNNKDRSWLQDMTEIERETILEERRELITKYQNRLKLKQLVTGQSKPDIKPKLTGKSKQLDELKKKRQAKHDKQGKRAKKGSDDDSDDDDDDRRSQSPVTFSDDEDPSYAGDKGKKKSTKDTEEEEAAPKHWIDQIVLPRSSLATLWPTTFFADLVAGAYVRIHVGMRDGEPEYRLAQVVGVAERVTPKLYQLERFKTDMMLTLQVGNDKQDFTMDMISNAPVSEREFARFQAVLKHAKLPLPTTPATISKKIALDKQMKYTLTEADINRVLTRNKAKSTNQKGGAVLHDRHLLVNQRDIALRAGNEEEVARINGQLKSYAGDALEPQLPMLSTNSPVQAEKKVSTFDERRKQLAAGAGSSAPKALGNKTTSAQNSRPGSGASTPVRQPQAAAPGSAKKESNGHQGPNRFQKLLASKVEVDLGDF